MRVSMLVSVVFVCVCTYMLCARVYRTCAHEYLRSYSTAQSNLMPTRIQQVVRVPECDISSTRYYQVMLYTAARLHLSAFH